MKRSKYQVAGSLIMSAAIALGLTGFVWVVLAFAWKCLNQPVPIQ